MDTYFAAYRDYADRLDKMSELQTPLTVALHEFDESMGRLARCNATCEDSSTATPGPQPILGPDDAEAKAECSDCDGDALKLKAVLTLLRHRKAELLEHAAERAALDLRRQKRELTADELHRVDVLDKLLPQEDRKNVAQAEKQVTEARAALDLCNSKCPRTTTEQKVGTPTSTGGDATQSGAAGAKTGGVTGSGAKGGMGRTPTVPPTTTPPAVMPPTKTPPPGGAQQPNVENLSNIEDTVQPIAPGASPPMVAVGPSASPAGYDSRSYEAPPKDLTTGARFTFVVANNPFMVSKLLDNFNVHIIAFDFTGRVLMGTDPGVNPDLAWSHLQGLQQDGVISDLEEDPCFAAASVPAKESPDKMVHLSGSLGATLLDPLRQRPVAGASIMVGPLSPTPFFNPGERPGDDQPPTIVKTDSSGNYTASLAGLSGPIEISVAKGCDSHTSFAIADGPGNAPPASTGVPATQH